ncbi:hypothetical protein M885DRAFT_184645 [Pelagophyceae sp. CCMP2097]|nr:hypothetical protein M885DRAFT_184645 [Pelagophyceae sp. CCMP2097]
MLIISVVDKKDPPLSPPMTRILRESSLTAAQYRRVDCMSGPGVNVSVERLTISVVFKNAPSSSVPPTTSTRSASTWTAAQPPRPVSMSGPAVKAIVCMSSTSVVSEGETSPNTITRPPAATAQHHPRLSRVAGPGRNADARACVPDVRLVRPARPARGASDREACGGDVTGFDMDMRVRRELPPCGAVPGDAGVEGGADEDARRVDGDGPQKDVVEEGVALEVARRRVEQRDAFLAADGDRRARVAARREDGDLRPYVIVGAIRRKVEPGAGLRPEVPKGRTGAREREDAAAAKLGVDDDDGAAGEATPPEFVDIGKIGGAQRVARLWRRGNSCGRAGGARPRQLPQEGVAAVVIAVAGEDEVVFAVDGVDGFDEIAVALELDRDAAVALVVPDAQAPRLRLGADDGAGARVGDGRVAADM